MIGAGGVFGSRLAEGLARAGFELVLAGRDLARAEATATDLRLRIAGARVTTVRLDTRDLTAAELAATGARIIVDAAGPFQGVAPRVARAAIAAGLHYVDQADARDFVAAFPALDAAARAAGVVALTGASSTPALSHAVLNALTDGWQRIDSVEAAISPGARAPRGRSVTEAILSWLGRPVRVFEGGAWRERPGWSALERRRFGAAGRRWLSLCETPDLDLLPARFQPTDRAVFLAGLEPAMAHWGAWGLGRLARARDWNLPALAPAVIALSKLAAPFGDDRGAMRVEAMGLDAEGRGTRAVWTLIAPPGVGPHTPGLPALAVVKALAAGRPGPGARPCVADLSLAEIEAEMVVHGIETTTTVDRESLFARAIGPVFDVPRNPYGHCTKHLVDRSGAARRRSRGRDRVWRDGRHACSAFRPRPPPRRSRWWSMRMARARHGDGASEATASTASCRIRDREAASPSGSGRCRSI